MLSAEVDTILLRDLHNFSHYKEAEFDNHKVLLLIQRFLSSYSQTRSSVPVANELMNSITEKWFRLLIQ